MTETFDMVAQDRAVAEMQTLVLEIAKALVDYPEAVNLSAFADAGTVVLRLEVSPRDLGKVIGKQGRTARSLRTILGAASMKLKHRFALDIVEQAAADGVSDAPDAAGDRDALRTPDDQE